MFRMFLKQAVLKPKYMYMYLRWFSNEAYFSNILADLPYIVNQNIKLH